MSRIILFCFLLLACCTSMCTAPTSSPALVSAEDSTKELQAAHAADSTWWGIWREDSASDKQAMFPVAPLYYYFLPDGRTYATPALRDSITDLSTITDTDFFSTRNDSVFMAKKLVTPTGEKYFSPTLMWSVGLRSGKKVKVIFPNGNKGWFTHIATAKKGVKHFIREE